MIPSFVHFNSSQTSLTYSLYKKTQKKITKRLESNPNLSPISSCSSIFLLSPSSSVDSISKLVTINSDSFSNPQLAQITCSKLTFRNFFKEFNSSSNTNYFGFPSGDYKKIRNHIGTFLTIKELISLKTTSHVFNRLIYNPQNETRQGFKALHQADPTISQSEPDRIQIITAKWLIELKQVHQEERYFNPLGEKIEDYTLLNELSQQATNIQIIICSYLGIDQVIKISQSFNHLSNVFFEFSQNSWDIQLAESYLNESELKSIKNTCGKGKEWLLEQYLKRLNSIQFEDYLQHISIKTRTGSLPILQKCSAQQLQSSLNLAAEIGYLDGVRDLILYTLKFPKNLSPWNCFFFQGDFWIDDQKPILLAFQNGHLNIINFFEMHGSDIPLITTVMLHITDLDKKRKVIKYYLQKALKNSSDKQNLTLVLKYAIEVNLHKEVCSVIWNKYCPTSRNEFLIQCAIEFNKIKTFKFMYDYWGKVSELSWSNIFTFAAKQGRLEIVNFLLKECFFGEEILLRAKKNASNYPEIINRLNEFLEVKENHRKFRETSCGH